LLDKDIDPNSEHYGPELRASVRAIEMTLNTQLRVDENELRRQAGDAMPRILEAIKRVERGLPKPG